MFNQQSSLQAAQVEALAARQNRHRHFADFGRGENEFYVRWRLFEGFQQGVESRRGQHVHLIDDVDLVTRRCRLVLHCIIDFADIVDTGM